MNLSLRHFKALSDETRLRLMCVLMRYELSVNELVSILEMGQSRVSRHLKILTEAGLLDSRRDGLWVFYAAVSSGSGFAFLQANRPLFEEDALIRADIQMASQIIEERALKTRQFFNTIAEHWDTLSREVLGGYDLAEAVCAAIPDPCTVAVDLGCGTGIVLERMYNKATQVIGVDGSPRMLELSRRRLSSLSGSDQEDRLSLRIGDLSHLPLRDGEGDFASINMVLHHISEPAGVLGEIHRVLHPGALLLVADFDQHNQERMRIEYGDLWLGFSEASMTQFLTSTGFSVLSCLRRPVEQGLALNLTLAERV